MIHNEGNHVRSRTAYDAPTPLSRPTQQGCSWRVYSTPANRSGADTRRPSGKRPGRTNPALYRAGLLDLCRSRQWVENAPFSQGAPYPAPSAPNQRPAQRRVAVERADRIDAHRDLAQPRLRRSLCLWAASHRSAAAQTRTTWLRSGAQADGRMGDASTGRVSGLYSLGAIPAEPGTAGREYPGSTCEASSSSGGTWSRTGRGSAAPRADLLWHVWTSDACCVQIAPSLLV